MKEAFEDSRSKAALVAEAMGQKIVDIEEVLHSDTYRNMDDTSDEGFFNIMSIFNGRPESLADKLAASRTTVSESIDIIWIIE